MDIKQKLLTLIPSKEAFLTDSYVSKVLESNRWSLHGDCLSGFIGDVLPHYDEVSHLLEKDIEDILSDQAFIQFFKYWLNLRYDYVVQALLGELSDGALCGDTLTINRSMYLTEEDAHKVCSGAKSDVGIYWSTGYSDAYNADLAEIKTMKMYVIMAKVSITNVNWHETLVSRFDYCNGDQEMEINLSGMPNPTIIDIEDDSGTPLKLAA